MEMEKRKVSDPIVETVHMVRPQHLNASDRLFGGALMQWIDEVAGMVAKRHTRRNVITASVDSLSNYENSCSLVVYQKDVNRMRNNRMHTMHRSVYSDTSGYKNHHFDFRFPL